MKENTSSSQALRWMACFGLAIATGFAFSHEPLPNLAFWIITVLGISIMALELLPVTVVGVFLPMTYIIAGVGGPKLVLSPWTTAIPWIVLAGVLISRLMEKTQLSRRIALLIIATVGTSPVKLMIALACAGYVLGLCIPEAITNVIVMLTITKALCDQLDFAPKTREANVLMFAGFFGAMVPQPMYLPNNLGIVAAEMIKPLGIEFTWIGFAWDNLAPTLLLSVVCILLLIPFVTKKLNEQVHKVSPIAKEEIKAMGPISLGEKKALVVVILGILVFLTETIHHLPAVFLFLFVALLAFTPLFSSLDESDLEHIPYGIIFFITGTVAIGVMAGELGIAKWLASTTIPLLENVDNPVILAVLSYIAGFIVNFILTPLAAVTSLSIPLVEICQELNFSVKPILYSYLYGLEQVLLPYEAAPLLYLYSTGYISLRFFVTIMALRFVLAGLVIAISAAALWPMMGV